MSKFNLTLDDYHPFFEDYVFYGLRSNAKPSKLCWELEHYLAQGFIREPETDIPVKMGAPKLSKSIFNSLFETKDTEQQERTWAFHALIKTEFSSTKSIGYIYQNKVQQSLLMKELDKFDYIFANPLKNKALEEFMDLIYQIPSIQYVHKVNIFTLPSKSNLLL